MLLSPKCVFSLNIIVLSCLFESLYNLSQPVGAIEFPKSDFFFFTAYSWSSSTCFLSFCISCRLATRSRGLNGLRFNPLAILYLMFYSFIRGHSNISLTFLWFPLAGEAQGLDLSLLEGFKIVMFYHFVFILAGMIL